MNHNEETTVYDCCSVRGGGVSGSQLWQSDDGSGDHVAVDGSAVRAERNRQWKRGESWWTNHDSVKPVTNHDGGRPWMTTHGSDERGQDAERALWRQHQGSESVRARITEKAKDERGSAQAVARCAYALQMHEVDRGRPQQHDHSGMSLEKDHVQTRASSRCSATHGEDACGGESWPTDQGKEQSWTE